MGQSIIVKGKQGISAERLRDDLEGVMRSIRRLKPTEENNFALNEVSLISGQLDNFFRVFNLAGWIIGGFAILVGGFGIANIMFVSVRERTRIIGIQKSLGAKNYFIMLEFLFESVVLSVMGGLIGLLIVYAGALFVSQVSSFHLSLTLGNIFTGIFISATIGVVAGLLPARRASGLDPVTAINTV
jgi:putative ABC transport system permease protein